ncbi:colicin V production CvpA [Salinibacter sp. 10B]|uniref:CvpA family protein n=1 Tax=Salinibacter sp. 10B TaxID=1923971 RepID=UPI000CF4D6F9|nr:CvpA family protein [Salinibacter sp. 10B]PQJ33502.1 colicin V production CvpA [Salinibacter sp. 10B]
MELAGLDWFILIVLAGGLVRGFMVGAVRQIASLLGLVLAFFLSVQLMHPVGTLIVSSLGLSASVAPIAGFIAIFVGVQLVFWAVSRLLEQILETLSLNLVNRAAGGALGGFKAALLLSVLFLVLSGLEMPSKKTRKESVLYSPVASALPETLEATSPYLPAAKRASETFGHQIKPRLQPSVQEARGGTDDR